jgi:hypothetical protein
VQETSGQRPATAPGRHRSIKINKGGCMRKLALALTTLSLVAVAARPAEAQFRFGPSAGFGTDADFLVGARALLGFPSLQIAERPLTGQLSFDYFLDACTNCTWWEITPAMLYTFPVSGSIGPYAGAGINISHFGFDPDIPGVSGVSDNHVGLGIMGGIFLPISTMTGQAEARFDLSGGEQLVLTFSLLFGSRGGS